MNRIATFVFCAAVLFILGSCAAKQVAPPEEPVAQQPEPVAQADVEILQLQVDDAKSLDADQRQARLKIRIEQSKLKSINPAEIYLIDETTKKKYPVVRLQRIDALAEYGVPGEKGVRYIMFWNHDGGLRAGKKVTVNVGNHRESMLIK